MKITIEKAKYILAAFEELENLNGSLNAVEREICDEIKVFLKPLKITTQTLHLNLTKKWYDMILSGEKKEEYRELSDYWKIRMKNVRTKNIQTITFSNGYAKNRRQFVIELLYISIRTGIIEWGAENDKVYFVIHLGKLLK